MKRSYIRILAALMAAASFSSCSDNNENAPENPAVQDKTVGVTVKVNLPQGVEVSGAEITFTNVSSSAVTAFGPDEEIRLLPGLYDVAYRASAVLHDGVPAEVRASQRSVRITGDTAVNLEAFLYTTTDDLVISEIFFAGTLNEAGNQYTGDNYVKLYNNTDHVVYADGVALFETTFMTVQNYDYQPDIKSEAVAVDAVYVVPGSGTDHPVAPGEYLLIADNGMDHRSLNPNSFDLSHADFEWYDISYNPSYTDIDNPEVPDMEQWFSSSNTMFSLHNRGYKSYGIARIPCDRTTYLGEYAYNYTYQMILPAGVFEMHGDTYSMPNDWVIDMVNLSVDKLFTATQTDPRLDTGWTGCGTIDMDPTRYFHSVRRKFLAVADGGRIVLKDTNDSTEDFNRNVTASEIELQHSAVNMAGDKASSVTVDGVTICK